MGTNYSIIDPCGGPKELLNKINPSPCVFVAGEAMVAGGYANISTNGSISVTGPLMNGVDLPISGNANLYPNLLIAFGVSPNSQIQLALPSSIQVNTRRFGSFNGTSNTSFDYKQLVYFSQTKFTLAAVDVGYTAPTGNSSGPAYLGQLMFEQPFNQDVGLGGAWTFQNTSQSTGLRTTQRVWSDPIVFYLSYSPPASPLALFPTVEHNFSPNRTIVIGDVMYLLSRHFLISAEYGGLGVSAAATGPFNHLLTFSATANPRIFGVDLYYLIGESNLPPTPPQPAPTPTP